MQNFLYYYRRRLNFSIQSLRGKVGCEFDKESVAKHPVYACSRGRHVSESRIWIAYEEAGAHTCEAHVEEPRRVPSYIRTKKTERIHNAQTLHFPSGLFRGGVLYNVRYWICLKLFKFEQRKTSFSRSKHFMCLLSQRTIVLFGLI